VLNDTWFCPRYPQGICPILEKSGLTLGSAQPSIQWISRALSAGVQRLGRETNNTSFSADFKNAYLHISTPPRLTCLRTVTLNESQIHSVLRVNSLVLFDVILAELRHLTVPGLDCSVPVLLSIWFGTHC
jgi:hypothetical protein